MLKQIRQILNVVSIAATSAEDVAHSVGAGTRVLRSYAEDWEEQEKHKQSVARKQRKAELKGLKKPKKTEATSEDA